MKLYVFVILFRLLNHNHARVRNVVASHWMLTQQSGLNSVDRMLESAVLARSYDISMSKS